MFIKHTRFVPAFVLSVAISVGSAGCAAQAQPEQTDDTASAASVATRNGVFVTPLRDFKSLDISGGPITTNADVTLRFDVAAQ